MIRVLGLSLYGPQAASHRVRLSQFQPGLAAAGIDLQIQSLLDNAYLQRSFSGHRPSVRALLAAYRRRLQALRQADRFDLAIVHCELLPFLPVWLERQLLQIPFLYDCDDAFFLKYRSGCLRLLQPLLGAKTDRLMAAAEAVTAGNAGLAAYASRFSSNVVLLRSVVDTDQYRPSYPSQAERPSKSFTVGWIGSPSTTPYLQLLIEPLQQFARERPVRLLVVGGPAPAIPGVEVIEQPWSLEQEVPLIQQFDVGVMPLPETPWACGKCAYKLIQCMACSIPVVASRVGANVDAVPNSSGILVESPDQWLAAFRRLANDSKLRQRMGVAARQWVEQRYSLRSVLPVLTGVIQRAVANHPSR
ncbi:MAG: glycosyltransferase family 4 protein [Cyanobacteria bacterium K_Offshore_0m_m2_072]|nr:glycosyltransferase family 4 protein [Cyanobacteria bacterium K_Offshore_0m_m2_072]